jgi:putative Holliday junction resolvase
MILTEIADFAAALVPARAIAGLDLGEKTVGVAVSDRLLSVASPLTTIRRTKFTADAAALLKIVTERELAGLILGLPRNMDGSEGPRCQSARFWRRIRPESVAQRLLITSRPGLSCKERSTGSGI